MTVILTGCVRSSATESEDAELSRKFTAMYNIGDDGKTITVISREYPNEFWKSNYEKEKIRSLSAKEIHYIIRDSIQTDLMYNTSRL